MKFVDFPFMFTQGHTIEGALKLYNSHDVTEEEMDFLISTFERINEDATPPKIGRQYKIPVLSKFASQHDIV